MPLIEAKFFDSIIMAANLPYAQEALKGYQNSYFFDPNNILSLANQLGNLKYSPNKSTISLNNHKDLNLLKIITDYVEK
jgi:hypothetical protein